MKCFPTPGAEYTALRMNVYCMISSSGDLLSFWDSVVGGAHCEQHSPQGDSLSIVWNGSSAESVSWLPCLF